MCGVNDMTRNEIKVEDIVVEIRTDVIIPDQLSPMTIKLKRYLLHEPESIQPIHRG